ncbi:MAG TPA: hydroxymethylpyrimidine/phosphomethylpyrimidine kinase [Cytophagaceae bacterium]|jgi:hydroxymethylpyrimidine/phosphomethylpyrimidine kinase|nr:hydroxymethylpyrimidine/phosphomethylpyrimidine kinase [Cytophagaceae bacterium]
MKPNRPVVISIAGFDPCGGAGVLADIKVFENIQVQGMGVCTSLTFQNENEFEGLTWVEISDIKKQIDILLKKYTIEYVKIGLVQNLNVLNEIIDFLIERNATIKIVWDPILKASAGYDFHTKIDYEVLLNVIKKLFMIVPNLEEIIALNPVEENVFSKAEKLSEYCNVFLKGGHSNSDISEDVLFMERKKISFQMHKIDKGEKHGSGCVLSSSLIAYLALGFGVKEACEKAKKYTFNFLSSNEGLLGYHN